MEQDQVQFALKLSCVGLSALSANVVIMPGVSDQTKYHAMHMPFCHHML